VIQITGRGEDAFGKFTVAMPGNCETCRLPSGESPHLAGVDAVVQYDRKPKLPAGIAPEATILQVTTKRFTGGKTVRSSKLVRQLGITCGCYAKLHRQVVHIEESIAKREAAVGQRNRTAKAVGGRNTR
jgi:hypothetical protein